MPLNCPKLRSDLITLKLQYQELESALVTVVSTGTFAVVEEFLSTIESSLVSLENTCNPFEVELSITEQYNFQVNILKKYEIVKELEPGVFGIIGVDGKAYSLPTLEEVIRRMIEKRDILKDKTTQGFTKLLLVPIGMPLSDLAAAYGQALIRHHREGKLFATKHNQTDSDEALIPVALDASKPVWKWEELTEENIFYYPHAYNPDSVIHQGKTKLELLQHRTEQHISSPGWNILLMEDLPNIPRENNGTTIGNRPQLTTNQSPREYLTMLQASNPQSPYHHETTTTIEDWLIYALTHLETTNQVIDDYQGTGSIAYQLGSYVPSSDNVGGCFWGRVNQQAALYGNGPESRDEATGVRSAVGV